MVVLLAAAKAAASSSSKGASVRFNLIFFGFNVTFHIARRNSPRIAAPDDVICYRQIFSFQLQSTYDYSFYWTILALFPSFTLKVAALPVFITRELFSALHHFKNAPLHRLEV